MQWRVVLCSCNETLPVDVDAVQRALGLDEAPERFDRLPRDQIHRFMDWLGRERPSRVVVGCCAPAELIREAASAAGVSPSVVDVVNLREACFWTHPDPATASAKAARLLRAAMRTAETTRPASGIPVKVGTTVLIASDSSAGIALARRLGALARPILILDERSSRFDGERARALPWKVNWGRVVKVDGALGAFRVTVEHQQPIDLRACIYCERCIPVCHTSAISHGLRLRMERCDRCGDCLEACAHVGAIKIPRAEREAITAGQVVVIGSDGTHVGDGRRARTGHHRVVEPSPADLDALTLKVLGLVGEFQKPAYVHYDPHTCAGGAAGRQACGRCVPACPYDAIARDPREPLRVMVDLAGCEGCGACVAVCPTSSLTFADPAPTVVDARLRALLAPLPGAPAAPLVVAYHCPEQGASTLDDAGRARRSFLPSVLPMSMACLRHVSEADLLTAFRYGAAGVALVGCEACPHGERQALLDRLAVVKTVLEAFGLGGDRVQMISGEPAEALAGLERFAAALAPSPVGWDGDGAAPAGGREAIAQAVGALIAATGREPGRIAIPAGGPFAIPDVRVAGCTVCRTCVNVCPTHAFRFDESRQALELRQVSCVNCGLCAAACPESVITLRPELALDRAALDYATVVRDDMLACTKCGVAFGNRRAVAVIESKLLGMANLLDTFAGTRRTLLRMCPNCRAVAAMQEMEKGWEP